MASNDKKSLSAAPNRRNFRLILLIVLVILALIDGALLIHLHHQKAVHKAALAAVSSQSSAVQQTAPAIEPPHFDIVRVGPQGDTVIAGRGAPGAKVTIKDGNVILGVVVADAHGQFVLLPTAPLAAGTHEITLSETLPNGQVVDGVQSASVDLAGAGKPVLTVVSGPGGSAVVTGQGPQAGNLAMGAVDYDTHGHAIFSGTAPAGANVTVVLGGQALGTVKADASGHWHLSAQTPNAAGMITLNATTSAGAALPSVSVPFAPEQLATALTDGHVVIEPGDNLWMIARKVYGHGVMYSLIYSANAGQIHNPNLIFPGQNFVLPQK